MPNLSFVFYYGFVFVLLGTKNIVYASYTTSSDYQITHNLWCHEKKLNQIQSYEETPDSTWSPPARSWLCFTPGTPCAKANILAESDFPTDLTGLNTIPKFAWSIIMSKIKINIHV